MAYAYGMRFDDDSNAITVIDEENQTAVTSGYIDGEYVEFDGGGNPNNVQTITATAENPCAGIRVNDLYVALQRNNASAVITLSNEDLGIMVTMPIQTQGTSLIASRINDPDNVSGFYAAWQGDGDDATARNLILINNGQATDGTSYASVITSVLTITWHPMPT